MLETCLLTLVTAANSLYTSFYYVLYWSYMTGHLLVNSLNTLLQYVILTWENCACFFGILSESLAIFVYDNLQLLKLVLLQVGNAIDIVCSSFLGTYIKCSSFVRAILNTISWIFYCLWGGVTVLINGVISLVTLIKKLFIIFGSGVWFLITLLPISLYYGSVLFTKLISSFVDELGDICSTGLFSIVTLVKSIAMFVIDVPFESVIGLVVGLSFVYIITQFYMILFAFIKRKYRLVSNWYRRQHIFIPLRTTGARTRREPPLTLRTITPRRRIGVVKQPSDANKNHDDEDFIEKHCVICQERIKCVLLLPCKHLCLCSECSDELRYYNQTCPICRTDIDSTMKIFV